MTRRQPPYTGEPPRDLSDHPFYGLDIDEEQMAFRDAIWDAGNLLVVCNACAGTGKTTIAIATGNLLVEYRRYRRMIYIANPVQEGRLGYLPGTVGEKSSVYAEPLYGALSAIGIPLSSVSPDSISVEKYSDMYIQFTTPVYLRGTNISESVVVIDEAQNYSMSDLRKTLTRIKDSCKVIMIGHTGQIDTAHNDGAFQKYLDSASQQPFAKVCTLTHNHRGVLSAWADSVL